MAVLQDEAPEERRWPHVYVRTQIYRARALRLLDHPGPAADLLRETLSQAESYGFRFFQLAARHELVQVAADDDERARHARIAVALARSLAANLPMKDGHSFQAKGWGRIEA